jgi:uncharacterized membrane protein (GlpM family)
VTWPDAASIAVKTLAGGILVLVFAVVSEVVKPKSLSGVFAAAPAVALAGMTVSGVAKGLRDVHVSAAGMIAGAVALVAYCMAVVVLHPRLDALRSSFAALLVWVAVAGAAYAVVAR